MKLSEAISLGATLRPQAIGSLRTHPGSGYRARTCAIGAALEATGVKLKTRIAVEDMLDSRGGPSIKTGQSYTTWEWPEDFKPTLSIRVHLPCGCTAYPMPMHRAIPHLNDKEKWSRERIAQWVKEMEDVHEAAQMNAERSLRQLVREQTEETV